MSGVGSPQSELVQAPERQVAGDWQGAPSGEPHIASGAQTPLVH
jgi:hypothetical protein